MQVGSNRQWTCLFYLNGQGNLREEETRHLSRLHAEGSSDDVQVVADLYRSDWKLTPKTFLRWVDEKLGLEKGVGLQVNQDWRGRSTFVVRNGAQADSQTVAVSNSPVEGDSPSDWKVLKNFLVDAMQQYPAEHFALTVSSHGRPDHILTDRSGRSMELNDLRRAIGEAEQETGQSIEVLTLEACQVGRSPSLDQLHQVVPYIIASPETIRAGEAPHASIIHQLKENPSQTPKELALGALQTLQQKLPEMRLYSA